jgi:hypothetical protein
MGTSSVTQTHIKKGSVWPAVIFCIFLWGFLIIAGFYNEWARTMVVLLLFSNFFLCCLMFFNYQRMVRKVKVVGTMRIKVAEDGRIQHILELDDAPFDWGMYSVIGFEVIETDSDIF